MKVFDDVGQSAGETACPTPGRSTVCDTAARLEELKRP